MNQKKINVYLKLFKCQFSRTTHTLGMWGSNRNCVAAELCYWPGGFPSHAAYSGCDLSHQKQMVLAQILEKMVSSLGVCCAGTAGKALTQLRLSTETLWFIQNHPGRKG